MRKIILILIVLMFIISACDDAQVAQPINGENNDPQFGITGDVQKKSGSTDKSLTANESIIEEAPKLPVCGDAVCDETELDVCEEDCPNCDDSNKCTVDSFSIEKLACKNVPIKNCCGDGFCGPSETCSEDCPTKMLTLASYPYPFVHGDELEADIIVGDLGTAKEVSGATAIAVGLGLSEGVMGKLASDLSTIKNKNVILIGNPCTNVFIEQLMPFEDDCAEDYEEGEGRLSLFFTGTSDGQNTYAIVVSGHSSDDVRRAANILGEYERNMAQLKGTIAKV